MYRNHRAIRRRGDRPGLDLFELVPSANAVMKKATRTLFRFAPSLWSRIFRRVLTIRGFFVPQIRFRCTKWDALGEVLRKNHS